jgi:hypothetical protein
VQQHHTYLQPRPATRPTVVHRHGRATGRGGLGSVTGVDRRSARTPGLRGVTCETS